MKEVLKKIIPNLRVNKCTRKPAGVQAPASVDLIPLTFNSR